MNRLQKFMAFFMLILVLGAGVFANVLPANAQSRSDYEALLERLEQIEKEMRTLQRSAARGKLPASNITQPILLPSDQPPLLANMEVRISQLERELRSLTGQIEELVNRQDIMEREMDLFRKDIEFQLREGAGGYAREDTASDAAAGDAFDRESPPPVEVLPIRPILPSGDPAAQYDFAFSQLKRGDFAAAQAAFEAFLEANPENELAGNAQYWLGETFYVRKDYPRAAEAFLRGFQNYSESNKGPDSLLKLGMTLSAMDKAAEACTALAELDARYPDARPAIKTEAEAQKQRLGC